MKSISSFEWTIVLLACLLYLIVYSAAGLPRAGPAGQTWPNIRFNLACQMFLVIKKFKLRRTLYYFFVFFHCLCGQIVWDLPNVIMMGRVTLLHLNNTIHNNRCCFCPEVHHQVSSFCPPGENVWHPCSRMCDQYTWEKGCLSGSIGGYVCQMMRKYDLYLFQ